MERLLRFTPKGTRTAGLCLAVTAVTFGACLLSLRANPVLPPEKDAMDYYQLASNLAAGHGFSIDGVTPSIARPPLFSLLLGSWFRLTGSSSLYSAGLFQGLMHSLACGAAFLLFMEVFGRPRLALGLALWLGLMPPYLARVSLILEEPAITLFTTAALLLSLRLLRKPSAGAAAGTGAAWGLCTLSKSVGWFGPLLTAALQRGEGRFPFFKKTSLILLLSFAAVLSPWVIRNYARFGRLIAVNAQGGIMLEGYSTMPYKHSLFNSDRKFAEGAQIIKGITGGGSGDTRKSEGPLAFIKKAAAAGYFIFGRTVSGSVYFTFPDFFQNWYMTASAPPPRFRKLIAYGWWLLLTIPLYLVLLYRCVQFVKRGLGAPLSFLLVFYLLYWAQYALIWCDARYSVPVYPVLLCLLPVPERRGAKPA